MESEVLWGGHRKNLLLSGHLGRARTSRGAYKGLVLGCDLEKSEPEEAQVPPTANEETKSWRLSLGSPGESEPRGSPAWDCSPVACNSGSPSHFPGLLSQRHSRSPSPAARALGPSPSRGCSQGHRQHLARQTWIFPIRGGHRKGGLGRAQEWALVLGPMNLLGIQGWPSLGGLHHSPIPMQTTAQGLPES